MPPIIKTREASPGALIRPARPLVLAVFCRSLLAGDAERPPPDRPQNRLLAGSYIPTKPKHLSAIRLATAEASGYWTYSE